MKGRSSSWNGAVARDVVPRRFADSRHPWWPPAATAAGLVALTALLVPVRGGLSLAGVSLIYLAAVVIVAALDGVRWALPAAVVSAGLVNFYFVPPYYTLDVANRELLITLVVYGVVAVVVSIAVHAIGRWRAAALRSGIEAALLARISEAPLQGRPLTTVLDHVRETFGMTGVALLERHDGAEDGRDTSGGTSTQGEPGPQGEPGTQGVPVPGTEGESGIPGERRTAGERQADAGLPAVSGERTVAAVGTAVSAHPVLSAPAGEGLRLVADGPAVFAADRHLLDRLAVAAARALEAERLTAQAARARELAEIDKVRAALLAAVGHDLRTPLAGIKASVSSLREPGLGLTGEQRAELLANVDAAADKMSDLVENLLALSRLQAGALSVHPRPVALDEVVAAALLATSAPPGLDVEPPESDVADDLPAVWADPGLLERVIANLVSNALAVAPPGRPVRLQARVVGAEPEAALVLEIIDHGPGIPEEQRDRVFAPFQRLDDQSTYGLGLGLAIARGFTEAMNGTLIPTDTPGGGLTMTLTLPAAP